jgi:hypothetical protein
LSEGVGLTEIVMGVILNQKSCIFMYSIKLKLRFRKLAFDRRQGVEWKYLPFLENICRKCHKFYLHLSNTGKIRITGYIGGYHPQIESEKNECGTTIFVQQVTTRHGV